MAERFVQYGHEAVKVGDEVDVWVYRIPADGRLGLSMIEYKPSKVRDPIESFQGIPREDWFWGTVRYSGPDGFYVDVEAPDGAVAQGFLHKRTSDLPEVGSSVKVRVTRIVQASGTLYLSMRPPPE